MAQSFWTAGSSERRHPLVAYPDSNVEVTKCYYLLKGAFVEYVAVDSFTFAWPAQKWRHDKWQCQL